MQQIGTGGSYFDVPVNIKPLVPILSAQLLGPMLVLCEGANVIVDFAGYGRQRLIL